MRGWTGRVERDLGWARLRSECGDGSVSNVFGQKEMGRCWAERRFESVDALFRCFLCDSSFFSSFAFDYKWNFHNIHVLKSLPLL